jgi:hypothetical protein
VTYESADELMIRRFAGAQRDGIGRFVAKGRRQPYVMRAAVFSTTLELSRGDTIEVQDRTPR